MKDTLHKELSATIEGTLITRSIFNLGAFISLSRIQILTCCCYMIMQETIPITTLKYTLIILNMCLTAIEPILMKQDQA